MRESKLMDAAETQEAQTDLKKPETGNTEMNPCENNPDLVPILTAAPPLTPLVTQNTREGGKNAENATSSKMPSAMRFWTLKSTEAILSELDIWASVHRARLAGVRETPKRSAIFEEPRIMVDDYYRDDKGLKSPALSAAELGRPAGEQGDPNGTEQGIKTTTGKMGSPEMITYLSTNAILRETDCLDYHPVLLRYFPRTGPYKAAKPLDLDRLPKAHRQILFDVVRSMSHGRRKVGRPRG